MLFLKAIKTLIQIYILLWEKEAFRESLLFFNSIYFLICYFIIN